MIRKSISKKTSQTIQQIRAKTSITSKKASNTMNWSGKSKSMITTGTMTSTATSSKPFSWMCSQFRQILMSFNTPAYSTRPLCQMIQGISWRKSIDSWMRSLLSRKWTLNNTWSNCSNSTLRKPQSSSWLHPKENQFAVNLVKRAWSPACTSGELTCVGTTLSTQT